MAKKKDTHSLQTDLIKTLLEEHQNRRDVMLDVLLSIKRRMQEALNPSDGDEFVDEASLSMAIEHFRDVMETNIKNDGNIVKLIEIVLKYDVDEETAKDIQEYRNELSDNKLEINFDDN